MKRSLTNLILAFGSAFACAAGLHAEEFNMRGNIPFEFQASGKTHAAGTYLIGQTMSSPAITLRNAYSTKSENLGLAQGTERGKGASKLIFHAYGSTYFLAEVWTPEQMGTKLPVSAQEKQLRRLRKESEVSSITVACGRPSGDQ